MSPDLSAIHLPDSFCEDAINSDKLNDVLIITSGLCSLVFSPQQ